MGCTGTLLSTSFHEAEPLEHTHSHKEYVMTARLGTEILSNSRLRQALITRLLAYGQARTCDAAANPTPQ